MSRLNAEMQERLPEGRLLRLNDWAEPAGWLLTGVVIFLGFVALLTPSISSHSVSARIFAGIIWIGVGVMIGGGVRSGIILDKSGITVRGMFRSRHLDWSEIRSFEIKAPILKGSLRIELVDGEVLSTMALSGNSAKERALAKVWLKELNQRAANARVSA